MTAYTKFKEYIWLVNTIYQAHRITLNEINEKWVQTDMSEGVPFSRTTFFRHKCAIEDIFGIIIECDKHNGYQYYIDNSEVLQGDSIQNWMFSTLSVGSIVSESLALKDRILVEPISSCNDYLRLIIEAMKRSVRIDLQYQRYGADMPRRLNFDPYCIKLFSNRWYVLGHWKVKDPEEQTEDECFGIFAFDRIRSLAMTDVKFVIDKDFNAASYFEECFGVLVHDDTLAERVVIRAYDQERFYLRDLPLHHSQKEIRKGEYYSDFELYIRPTIDFCDSLLSHGNRLKVLSPKRLAGEIYEMHAEAAQMYEFNDDFSE